MYWSLQCSPKIKRRQEITSPTPSTTILQTWIVSARIISQRRRLPSLMPSKERSQRILMARWKTPHSMDSQIYSVLNKRRKNVRVGPLADLLLRISINLCNWTRKLIRPTILTLKKWVTQVVVIWPELVILLCQSSTTSLVPPISKLRRRECSTVDC